MKNRYSMWSVIGQDPDSKIRMICRCDCGTVRSVLKSNLSSGASKSCGCVKSSGPVTHGKSGTASYSVWKAMRARCNRITHKDYPRYGGAGIKVCERWDDFENFLADMGDRPSLRHSIDRIDVHGDYEPSNCRWATQKEQMNNTNRSVVIEVDGVSKTVSEWADDIGVSHDVLYKRIAAGWSHDRAIKTPVRKISARCKAA